MKEVLLCPHNQGISDIKEKPSQPETKKNINKKIKNIKNNKNKKVKNNKIINTSNKKSFPKILIQQKI